MSFIHKKVENSRLGGGCLLSAWAHSFEGYSSRGHSHPHRQKRGGTKTNATSQRFFKSTPVGQAIVRLSDLSYENRIQGVH